MAEQFPPLSAATLAAANQSAPGWRRTIWRRCPALPQVDVVVLAGNAVIPTIDAACRLAAAQGGPAADQRRRGTFYGLSLRGGAPGSPLP